MSVFMKHKEHDRVNENMKNIEGKTINGSELVQFIFMTILLFAFWLLLSGHFVPKLLIIGFVTSLIVAWITRPLMRLPSAKDPNQIYLALNFPYFKYLLHWLWLLTEIAKCNIILVKLILSPTLRIDPIVVTFKADMANPLALITLANSITLPPGTITIAIENGVYHVHGIKKELAYELAPQDGQEAALPCRVAKLFGEKLTD